MSEFYDSIEKLFLKKNPILISNVDNTNNNEYVLDLFLKKNNNNINFAFSKYLGKYGDALDLYDIYDYREFKNLDDFFFYFNERYNEYEDVLNEILKSDYVRYLK
ncbi:hypothetical protein ACG9XR_16515 [Acinetobacter guillouiae]|uniref:hypothetical protein n=1 Tax=Acinetobacter TaxID=469 RepID=UPI001FBA76F9|nr:hypothetical protein [Acinetobacter sp. NyZ410]UOH17709.1 hypothetical protein MTO68_18070 [Acinetobacter sp. NyZ410]